jgi:hypothetical protein
MEIITTIYRCDRCDADMGHRKPDENMTLRFMVAGEWSLERNIDWKHLCPPCKAEIKRTMDSLEARAGAKG